MPRLSCRVRELGGCAIAISGLLDGATRRDAGGEATVVGDSALRGVLPTVLEDAD